MNIERELINNKNHTIDNITIQLKKEFIGIDKQIDEIMSIVRSWYLFPELQVKPCVVNIFGMTGSGKTSLVERITKLLDREETYNYFNFSTISEESSWSVVDELVDNIGFKKSERILVYDEFQHAATINADGSEKDNRGALKVFWDILDTGVVKCKPNLWKISEIESFSNLIKDINFKHPMNIVNGTWVNGSEYFDKLRQYEQDLVNDSFCLNESSNDQFFIKERVVSNINAAYNKVYKTYITVDELTENLVNMSVSEIITMLSDICKKFKKGYEIDLRSSIIFVIANVDEAYDMSFNLNPDMSADQFHKITSNINIYDIKKSLQNRFRNEQIARLGNTHVIYPSFSEDSFRKIINLKLDSYAENLKSNIGLEIKFDDTIKDIIYNEGVYPTQGTRPIFSTIHEFIEVKIPLLVRKISDDKVENDFNFVKFSYKDKTVVTELYSGDFVVKTYTFDSPSRLEKIRNSEVTEKTANTAVHESGHLVLYIYLNGKIPEKVISRSVSSDLGGFMMSDYETLDSKVGSVIDYRNEIMVSLGGYIAEKIIFGSDRVSSGSSSDLRNVTSIATDMLRKWGFSSDLSVRSYSNNDNVVKITHNTDDFEDVNYIIDNLYVKATEILQQNHVLATLKKSSKYLLNNGSMSKSFMDELLSDMVSNGGVENVSDRYYRDIVSSF